MIETGQQPIATTSQLDVMLVGVFQIATLSYLTSAEFKNGNVKIVRLLCKFLPFGSSNEVKTS